MFFRHGLDKLIYPVIAVGVLIVVSYRPKYHLRTEMPADFFSSAVATSPRSSADKRIAWAYWESAQMDVQWKYPHGHPLPPSPPAEFHVDAKALGTEASDPATRQFYWHRLEQVWYLPESWTTDYEWDWGWAHDPLTSGAQWLREKTDRLFTGQ